MIREKLMELWRRFLVLVGLGPRDLVCMPSFCPRCRREVLAAERWILWDDHVWHLDCLAQARGWRVVGITEDDARFVNRRPVDVAECDRIAAKTFRASLTSCSIN